ncbi:MAG: DUF262 domain-containing HNH endonuclease family protein [Hyphomonadaceae bacterium]|nr:DUF262 domain-containing HNH endonuclease family protein [Hyphomonadaceae bacterium]
MYAETLNTESLWQGVRARPADVQRDFQWEDDQTGQLLADLHRAADEGADAYFLGSIIASRRHHTLSIYDGLQRLTALTILMAVLRDQPRTEEALAERLNACIRDGESDFRLFVPNAAPALDMEVQPKGEAVKVRKRHLQQACAKQVRFAASLYRKRLKKLTTEEINALGDFMLRKVVLIVIEVTDVDLARQIFVTTNTRGLGLSEADIFKGQLVELAAPHGLDTQVLTLWRKLSVHDSRLTEFLRAVDFLERGRAITDGGLLYLADSLRAGPGRERDSLSDWIALLEHRFRAWHLLLHGLNTPGSESLDAALVRLHLLRWPEWHPLALEIMTRFRDNRARGRQTQTAGRLRRLATRCMGLHLADFEPHERAKIFRNALGELRSGRDPMESSLRLKPSQLARLHANLHGEQADRAQNLTLLRWLEAELAGDGAIDHLQKTSVEHILPRNPDADSDWLRDFPDETERQAACHALGNLCLLPHSFNEARLGNQDYVQKRQAIQRAIPEDGLGHFHLIYSAFSQPEWTPEAITERTDWLRRLIVEKLDLEAKDMPDQESPSLPMA